MKKYYFVQLFYSIPHNVGERHSLYYNSDFSKLCVEVNFKRLFSEIYDYAYEYINVSFESEFKDSLFGYFNSNNLTCLLNEELKEYLEEVQFEELSCYLYDYIISANITNDEKLRLIAEYINGVVISSVSCYGYDWMFEIFAGDAMTFSKYFFQDLISNIDWSYYLPFKPFKERIQALKDLCIAEKYPSTDIHLGILLEWVNLYEIAMESYSSF